MTKRKHLKGRVRARAAKTGESYTTALRQIRARHQEGTNMSSQTEVALSCSFCKKDRHAVKKLIAGPGVYICDECIGLCNDILTNEAVGDLAPSPEDAPIDRLLAILRGTAATAGDIEAHLRARAKALRARGASVEQIAEATSLTPEEATARFDL